VVTPGVVSAAPSAPSAPVAVSEPPIGARPLALDEPEVSADEEHVSANVAGESDSTGTGAAAMTLCLLLGGGFFLWRKIKHHRPNAQNGRLITPLSTHFLGPKQGLLLLDVAGEMVLLGTSEKGVQMLTKIERTAAPEKATETPADRHARDAAAVAALAAQSAPAPVAPQSDESPKAGRAARLGAAIEKVRVMNARKAEKLVPVTPFLRSLTRSCTARWLSVVSKLGVHIRFACTWRQSAMQSLATIVTRGFEQQSKLRASFCIQPRLHSIIRCVSTSDSSSSRNFPKILR
jgi:flagellar protein FliO/FliZ